MKNKNPFQTKCDIPSQEELVIRNLKEQNIYRKT